MPIVKVNMTKGKSQDYIDKVSNSIDRALVEAYVMPENDLFQMFNQLEPGSFKFDRNFGVGPRSDDFMIIEIKSDARRRDEKEAFAKRVVERLAESPGVRPEDIFLILDNNSVLDDYSFGKGVLTSKLF
jgi:phenylpyruvate tautomerase PptA (4-oxalocrotonate tautomerase family)